MRVGVAVLVTTVLVAIAGSASASPAAFRKAVFARGFDTPVLLTSAPGEAGATYVVEQPGRVLRLRGGKRSVFLDIRSLVQYGGEQGLLGLAFHPNYARNRLFYVGYTSKSGSNTVARFRSNGSKALRTSRKLLLEVRDPYGNHNGGHLAFGPDGRLYTSIGDAGSGGDPEDRAQNPRSRFGKLLALDVSKPGGTWTIDALGLRNPWRFSFDRLTGDLYLGDVGQGSVEEVSFTPRSSPGLENYGWDVYEGSQRFEDKSPGPGKLVFPIFEYGHDRGCSITGGYVYRGSALAAERGRYVFGDYCSGVVWSLRVESGAATDVRREPFTVDSLSSFGENAAGELFAVSHDGVVYRIS
ncbi:MAG TPA: PQQ-dependent sugar dehydrogenase [Gaiellaceae bacterium]|nr:PQQ-dependent sugar dehydrogenase [Gaiellaceae bacterium]